MSHLHKNKFKDTKQLIPYINGFLWTLEILNDDTNHGQTYYVEEIERLDSYENSITNYLDKNYIATLKEITDWKLELTTTSNSFFEYLLHKVELTQEQINYITKYSPNSTKRDLLNFGLISNKYIDLMSELIEDGSKVYEVFINWNSGAFYECYHKDYIIDNSKGLFFIHFGTSD